MRVSFSEPAPQMLANFGLERLGESFVVIPGH